MSDSNSTHTDILSIMELPSIVTLLFERAHRPLLADVQGSIGLFVRYLRRKPERGLAVIYSVDEIRAAGKATRTNDPNRSVSLTLDEQALHGAHILFTASQAQQAPLAVQPTGVVRVDDLGLSVQAFPADSSLPALAASCDTAQNGVLFQALAEAARLQLQDDAWRLIAASAEPVRYKPANRCVIRYRLHLEQRATAAQKSLTIFGKVYANAEQARSVQELIQQLYDEQQREQSTSFLPRPLGMINAPGLTLNEAIQPNETSAVADETEPDTWRCLRTGTRALQPQLERGRGGDIIHIVLPEEELELTARALAKLHTSAIYPNKNAPRTGAKEAKRALERAGLIAGRNPEQAGETQQLAGQLAQRLTQLQPDTYRPAHGGFKASQLLFHSHRVFIVDFDGFCCADSALDVGYFLAYLRPSGLWYQSPGMRQWFEGAAHLFVETYQQAMLEQGMAASTVQGIIERSRLYEAALLFKIATRRVNRLNSPRSKELSAMLREIAACLASKEEE
ncbi:MAG TPA: phosphotransferase [Ktedonobacteraceae bacterium]|nr:phosphotransferase [Ktedonobacteraceae bacterium]